VREKAFLYVIVRNLGFGGRTNRSGPHLLLIGHKQHNDKRHWGVPGGLKDRSDPDSAYTAVREFLEEMGIKRRPNQTDVVNATGEMVRHGSFQKPSFQNVVPTNRSGFSAYGLVFDTALEFERKMGLTYMLRSKGVQGIPTIKDKYYVDMSSETKGYTYVPIAPPPSAMVLPTFPVSSRRNGVVSLYRAVRAANGLSDVNVTQLKLRRGVSERAMRNTRAML
jgi:ADP-ribose pyrophosphatase YjhB (NUDIX family)